MGQIFNRIKEITKSHISDSEGNVKLVDDTIERNDDDLNRIINELNSNKSKNNKSKNNFAPPAPDTMTIEKANLILGTKSSSTTNEVKSAYLRKIKEYHPDKVASLGDELRNLAERKTIEIILAYEFLTKV